jgi:ABC-type uncharacterized transport system ATPase subunit
VTKVSNQILEKWSVLDINIEEVPIEEIIQKVFVSSETQA